MCGIGGLWEQGSTSQETLVARVTRMARAISHRGPDYAGVWSNAGSGLALGHRRLSIVDLSPAGHQPMTSASGRYVIAYNGEIYNHRQLRADVEARGAADWRGHSDTEVLLAAIEAWGLQGALERAVGMFAIALWDRKEQCLQLARDRIGEKPLYYGNVDGKFVFASELKAIRAIAPAPPLDRSALLLYLRLAYVPAPYCIYHGLRKVEPGSIVTVRKAGAQVETRRYWSALEVAQRAHAAADHSSEGNDAEQIEALDRLLRQSIRDQMVADVPVGAFLSGGIDSSTITALMQAQSSSRVHSYSIGFAESEYDEAPHARRVAQHLGTDHTELYVTPQEAQAVIPRLPTIYDEPFADSSQIPTFLLCQLARRSVTVALSGDAGDELFGGYRRYTFAQQIWQRIGLLPQPLRAAGASLITTLGPRLIGALAAPARALMPNRVPRNIAGMGMKAAAVLRLGSIDEVYMRLVSQWHDPAQLVPGAAAPDWVEAALRTAPGSDIERMMFADLVSYLPDDVLVKVDRAAMANSLETRVPLLDHRVVEFALGVPLSQKLRNGSGKWLLRQVLARYVPPALFERPKMGFGVPIDHWLRGSLKGWSDDLLDPVALRDHGLEPAPIMQAWREHRSGQRDWQYPLWTVLMLQAWLRHDAAQT
jgi:asparagine synthase (glutamine-hydrolysing)